MTSKPLNAIIIISIAIIRGSCNGSKVYQKVKQLEKDEYDSKKPSSNKKQQEKQRKEQPEKEKLPAGNQPETVIVF